MSTLQLSKSELSSRSKTLRVSFIATTTSGVTYYRMASFAWLMRRWPGVQTHVWPYSKNITVQNMWQVDMLNDDPLVPVKSLNRALSIRQYLDWLCETSDVVVWQALNFPHALEVWQDLRLRHQKPFLTEIDDYALDVPVTNEAYEQLKPGSTRYRVLEEQLRSSDGLIVSTPYLAKQYESFNDHIYVVPNSMDIEDWDRAKRSSHGDRIRIGWIGGGTHSADLEMIHPVIEKITRKYPKVWFYCIHGVPNCYKKMKQVYWTHRWSTINLYPRFLASFKFDIGVAPLVDNNFNRGKSNLRWLEYSALKIPTVASNLPDFERVITPGQTGFIAADEKAWFSYLEELVQAEGMRTQIGRNAYDKVKKDFNARKTSTNYMRLLKGIGQHGVFPPNSF